MHDSADVVVIGAGIVGISVAHHLARRRLHGRRGRRPGPAGADALARRSERPPARLLRRLTVDDGTVVLGSEPVLHPERGPVGFVTSAAYGHSLRRSLALAWVPADLSAPGTRLEIEYFGRRHSATVDPS